MTRAERRRQVHPRAAARRAARPGRGRSGHRRPGRRTPAGQPHRWRAADLVARIGTVFQNPEHQFVTGRVRDELALGPRRPGAADRRSGHRRRPAGPAAAGPAGGGEPVHALRRRAAPAVGGDRAGDRARGCWCSTSRPSARTGAPGPSWSTCSPSCATTVGVVAGHPRRRVRRLADRTSPSAAPTLPAAAMPGHGQANHDARPDQGPGATAERTGRAPAPPRGRRPRRPSRSGASTSPGETRWPRCPRCSR